jgi:hypothetical protein
LCVCVFGEKTFATLSQLVVFRENLLFYFSRSQASLLLLLLFKIKLDELEGESKEPSGAFAKKENEMFSLILVRATALYAPLSPFTTEHFNHNFPLCSFFLARSGFKAIFKQKRHTHTQ